MEIVTAIVILACTYILLAAGYVVVYSASRVLNFAHGGLMLLACYFVITLAVTVLQGQLALAILVAVTISFFLGVLVYRLVIRPTTGQPLFVPVILTLGVIMMIEGVVIAIWGSTFRYMLFPFGFENVVHSLPLGIRLSTFDIVTIALSISFLAGLGAFYKFSRLGMQLRGAAENTLLAAQSGISVHKLLALSWGIATVIGFIAGFVYSANMNNLSPALISVAIMAFPVAMVGGLNSLVGLIPGSLIVATAQVLAMTYVDPLLGNVVPMIILLLVLILRPWGMFGRAEEIRRV